MRKRLALTALLLAGGLGLSGCWHHDHDRPDGYPPPHHHHDRDHDRDSGYDHDYGR